MNININSDRAGGHLRAVHLVHGEGGWPYMVRAIETRQKTIADGLAAAEEASARSSSPAAAPTRRCARRASALAEILSQRGKARRADRGGEERRQGGRQPREGGGQGRDRAGDDARARAACATRWLRSRSPAPRRSCGARSTPGARRACSSREAAAVMAEPSTVARPYARSGVQPRAGQRRARQVVRDARRARARRRRRARARGGFDEPELRRGSGGGLFISILSGRLSGDTENFVRVLAENGRLALLPEIRAQFEALKNEHEGVLEAEVHAAFSSPRPSSPTSRSASRRRPGARYGRECGSTRTSSPACASSSATR